MRSLGGRGFALLTQRWHALRHIITSSRKTGSIIQAALALTHLEHHTTSSRWGLVQGLVTVSYAAGVAVGVMIVSYSTGVNWPSWGWRLRRW